MGGCPGQHVVRRGKKGLQHPAMRQAGITREKAGKPGDKVKILAYGAKDGTKNLAIVRTITFETGEMAGHTFRIFDLLDRQAQGQNPK